MTLNLITLLQETIAAHQMGLTIGILVVAAFFFVQGKIRSDVVALCSLLLLMLFQILTPEKALAGFSSNVVIMMIGLFIVGGAIFQTGLAKIISSKLLKLAGTSEVKLYFLVVLSTCLIGSFVSNTGTVALMLPIVVSMANGANTDPRKLLMPLAFASSLGGMMTLIGTPPNLVINDELMKHGYEGLSFFTFTPVGMVTLGVALVLLYPLSKYFLSDKGNNESTSKKSKSTKELVKEYQLGNKLYRARITSDSLVVNQKINELDIAKKYHISIIELRRAPITNNPFLKTLDQKLAEPNTTLLEHDIAYILGSFDEVSHFIESNKLILLDKHASEESVITASKLDFQEIGIAEVLLMPNSKLINKTIQESGFREKYNVNILAIQRRNEYILQELKETKLKVGDALLVQGNWKNIARLNQEPSEWVVVGEPLAEAAKVTMDHKAPLAGGIMLLMVLAMVLNWLPPVTAVLLAAVSMILTGCLRNVDDAYKTINWESIVLIGAMLPMSTALQDTGASALISHGLVSKLGDQGPLILLAGIYFTTSLLTMFISNTATAVLVAPIAMSAALQMGVSPMPFLFAVSVAASMCFASPFATPPNALVMSAGGYTFMDYVKVGLPLQVVIGIVMVFVLPLFFPF